MRAGLIRAWHEDCLWLACNNYEEYEHSKCGTPYKVRSSKTVLTPISMVKPGEIKTVANHVGHDDNGVQRSLPTYCARDYRGQMILTKSYSHAAWWVKVDGDILEMRYKRRNEHAKSVLGIIADGELESVL